jgi:signal transduction histidine kinase
MSQESGTQDPSGPAWRDPRSREAGYEEEPTGAETGWHRQWHHDRWPPAPPWWHEEHGPRWTGPPGPRFKRAWGGRPPSGGALFFRFAFVFGLFVVLACAILLMLGAAAFLFIPRPLPTPGSLLEGWHPLRFLAYLGGAVLLLLLALRRVGHLASHRLIDPLSATMKAAGALAEGDLSARVPVQGSPEFRHLALSFNRMAEALETADRQRRELLADVAHELRTPLTVIQGNLEGLRDGVYLATPEQIDLVLDETQKLSRLVDDLRLLTLADAGQLPLDLQDVEVHQLLADLRDAFAPQAAEAGVTLQVEAPHQTLRPLHADPQRVGQVLGNLLTNALRHTPSGGQVTLGAAPIGATERPEAVEIWVADTGEGVLPEDLPHIFDRFWRGDRARARGEAVGSGLGLAIARSLVQLHGGRIWAESEGVPGKGTTVSFVLPLSTAIAPGS